MSTYTITLHLRSLMKNRLVRYLRYPAAIVLVAALCAGLYFYLGFIKTPPACALENHHRAGNCPAQVLRWYPRSAIEHWYDAPLKWPASLNVPPALLGVT